MKLILTLVAAAAMVACNWQAPKLTDTSYAARTAGAADARMPDSAPQSYANVVDRVSPAVVTIRSARRIRAPQQFPFADDPFFRWLFGDRGRNSPRGGGGSAVERGLGSGVIVNANGDILTNHHVVDGADQITVEMPNRKTYSAKLLGSDAPSDLAVLKIDASNLQIGRASCRERV